MSDDRLFDVPQEPWKRYIDPLVKQKRRPPQPGVPDDAPGRLRRDDEPTSVKGAASIRLRAGSQKARLLVGYLDRDLTDAEAALVAGLAEKRGCCWWKRCGELREAGLIVPTGGTRTSPLTGEDVMVCRLADDEARAIARDLL